jgi:hypothetical protein
MGFSAHCGLYIPVCLYARSFYYMPGIVNSTLLAWSWIAFPREDTFMF